MERRGKGREGSVGRWDWIKGVTWFHLVPLLPRISSSLSSLWSTWPPGAGGRVPPPLHTRPRRSCWCFGHLLSKKHQVSWWTMLVQSGFNPFYNAELEFIYFFFFRCVSAQELNQFVLSKGETTRAVPPALGQSWNKERKKNPLLRA